ncbi:MAG: S8 family serine peptidase, partial [Phycisphaeraceae bacterium]|nr:S8 family serine peptidase [Phycisphaeraceae bacterium]
MSWLLEDSQDYITQEVLVRFNVERSSAGGPRTALSFYNQIVQELMPGAEAKRELTRVVSGLVVVDLPDFTSVQEAISLFNAESRVIYAEPEYRINVLAIPNDPRFPEQWNLNNEGQTGGLFGADINAPEGWDINNDANEIIVAVLDTGVDYNHPDLYPNMWYAEGFIVPEDVNQDDPNFNPEDPNYYVRDYGPDYVDGPVDDDPNDFGVDASAPEANGDPNDLHWHGTSVAGIIGARGDNEEGISGVAPIVKIMAIRVFDENAEIDEFGDVIDGIGFAVANGARIINMSWELPAYNASLEAAMAGAPDVMFVCSAGNDGENIDNAFPDPDFPTPWSVYPAALALDMNNVIAVMATDHFDQPVRGTTLANGQTVGATNYGPLTVTIGAPGLNILTCTPQGETDAMAPDDANLPTSYALMSGTSAAAPHISGALALALGLDDSLTPTQLKRRLEMWRSVDQVLPELCVSEGRLVLDKFLHLFEPKIVLNVKREIQYDSIQEAIDEAASDDDILAEAGGFYSEALDFLGKNIRVRSGDPENPDDVTAIDPINTVVYDVDELGDGFGVAFQSGETADAILLGFTVDHARDSGLFMGGSSPTIESCYVINSENSGVFCVAGSPVLISTVIEKNTTLYDGGGILAADGSVMTLQDCAVVGNIAVYSGGGVFCQNSTLVMEGSTILGNQTLDGFGGGVYSSHSPVDILDTRFIANRAPAWEGGGLYALASAVTLDSSTFSGNLGYDGGAVYCMDGTELAAKDCVFQSNEATFGGGAIGSTLSSVDVQTGLFVQNVSDSWDGGALFFNDTSAILANCTFSGNDSLSVTGRGGVMRIENGADVQVRDSIISDNFDGAAYVHDESSSVNFDHCLFHNNERSDYEEAVTGITAKLDDPNNIGEIPGEAILSGNPQFVTGHLGDFYLSQYVAGQILDANGVPVDPDVNPDDATSPAVDAGSGLAVDLGMNMSSTRTDNLSDESGDMDSGIVDIGFHYVDAEPAHYYVMVSSAVPQGTGTVEPLGGLYVQYTQILLTATVDDPNRYMFKAWENTDDDTRKDLNEAGLPEAVQINVVTMTEEKFVNAVYETVDIELRVVVDESRGNGEVTPRKVFVPRGETVTINATPDQTRFRAEWHNTNDDYATGMTNTVTIEPPFKLDRNGREIKEVRVEFFTPRILNVPEQYGHIQQAVDDASSGDIIVLAAQSTPYRVANGFSITKAITVQSARPDDPETVAKTIIEMESELNRDQPGYATKAFTFTGVEPNAVLNGVTIRGFSLVGLDGPGGQGADGFHHASPGSDVYGSAITCEFASPTIKNCVIIDCVATGGNGGNGAGATDTDPQGGHGGAPGMGLGGAIACMDFSNPIVTDCQFVNCQAIGGNGGDGGDGADIGLSGWGGGWDPQWAWTYEFTYSSADLGASFYGLYYDKDLKYAGLGGAAFVDDTSAPEFTRCEFSDNSSVAGVTGVSGLYAPANRAFEGTNRWQIDGYAGAVSIGTTTLFGFGVDTIVQDGKILYLNPFTGETQEEPFCKPQFVECSFTGNDVNEPGTDRIEDFFTGYGGAVAAFADSEPTFEKCVFSDNSAPVGGGYFGEDANPLFSDCDFEDNSAFHGGAMDITGGSSVIENSRFADNVADESAVYLIDPNAVAARGPIGKGGAIWHGAGTLTLQDSIIRDNEATLSGGGIYLAGGEQPLYRETLWNCLITGNLAGGDGGGLSSNQFAAPLLENCTLANNTVSGAGKGGGLSVSSGSAPKVVNSILWDNAGSSGSQIALIGESPLFTDASASLDIQFSDIQLRSGSAAIFVDDTTHVKGWDPDTQQWDPNTHNLNADPEFVMGYYLSQTDAGQPVQSPAVDAGNVDSDQTSRPM